MSTIEEICATSRRLPALPLATRKSMFCVNESISTRIGRCELMAKQLDRILIEVKGGPVAYFEVDEEFASYGTGPKGHPH